MVYADTDLKTRVLLILSKRMALLSLEQIEWALCQLLETFGRSRGMNLQSLTQDGQTFSSTSKERYYGA